MPSWRCKSKAMQLSKLPPRVLTPVWLGVAELLHLGFGCAWRTFPLTISAECVRPLQLGSVLGHMPSDTRHIIRHDECAPQTLNHRGRRRRCRLVDAGVPQRPGGHRPAEVRGCGDAAPKRGSLPPASQAARPALVLSRGDGRWRQPGCITGMVVRTRNVDLTDAVVVACRVLGLPKRCPSGRDSGPHCHWRATLGKGHDAEAGVAHQQHVGALG